MGSADQSRSSVPCAALVARQQCLEWILPTISIPNLEWDLGPNAGMLKERFIGEPSGAKAEGEKVRSP